MVKQQAEVTDLEAKVVRCVRELLRHPRGGKLEVYVNLTQKVGERAWRVLPLLIGDNEEKGFTRTDDLD